MNEQELLELCREPDIPNREIFKPNHFYGNAHALKRYAGFPASYRLRAVIQHGIYFYGNDFVAGGEMEALLPVFLPINEERAEIYRRLSGRPAMPIGSAFLYVKALQEQAQPFPGHQTGTIAFPTHSSRRVKVKLNHDAFARELAALPPEFHPITVSIYWRDYLDGDHQSYVRQGFRIITNGHMMDPAFSERVYFNCRSHRYACATEVGSHMFFSVESGCRFFLMRQEEPMQLLADEPRHLISNPYDARIFETADRLFTEPVAEITPEQQAFVDYYLGKDCFRSPSELRQLLQWAERLDYWAIPSKPIPGPKDTVRPAWLNRLPTYWQRKALRWFNLK